MKNYPEKRNQTLKKILRGKTALQVEEEKFHHIQRHHQKQKKWVGKADRARSAPRLLDRPDTLDGVASGRYPEV